MPVETAEPQVTPEPITVPKVPEPLKVKAGDKFRAEFEKLTKAQVGTPVAEPLKDEPKVAEPPKEPPKEAPPVTPTEEKKPSSPLDVVTADKKPEVKAEESDVLKEFEDEKTANWRKAREVMKRQSEEKKVLEATIAELKKTPKSDPEEISRLSKERDELKQSLAEREELIQSVDVRLSSDYQSTLKSRDVKIAKVASKAKAYGADADALVGAITLPDGSFKTQQIKAAMAEVDPEDKTEIRLLIGEVDGLNEKLQEFEKDAPKKYEEIQAKREAQFREQQETASKMVVSEFGKLAEALPADVVTLREVPEDVPDGTEWNQAIKSARENALRILTPGGSDFNESASIAYKGAHYDSLVKMFLKDHKELVDARKRLAEFDSGGPDFKGGEKPKIEPKLTPSQKYHKAMESLQAGAE